MVRGSGGAATHSAAQEGQVDALVESLADGSLPANASSQQASSLPSKQVAWQQQQHQQLQEGPRAQRRRSMWQRTRARPPSAAPLTSAALWQTYSTSFYDRGRPRQGTPLQKGATAGA